jgi:PAS domain S-box-containing protein
MSAARASALAPRATTPADAGWPDLFWAAFTSSRNPMVLLDERRRHVDANGAYLKLLGYPRDDLIGRPIFQFVGSGQIASNAEWQTAMASGHFTGETQLLCADGARVAAQWAATSEIVTGRRLVLVVALSTSRWGRHFRRDAPVERDLGNLSLREREIVRLVAFGNTGPEIADELQIAHDTVRTHVRNAMAKTGARSRAHLVAKALGEGLIFN